MLIDKKRRAETEQRKGLSTRTIVVVCVLIFGFVAAYLLTGWLFSSGTLSMDLFYVDLSIPSTVNENVIRFGLVLLLVFSLQFIAIMAFAVMDPNARKRPGRPSAVAQNPDFFDNHYDNI